MEISSAKMGQASQAGPPGVQLVYKYHVPGPPVTPVRSFIQYSFFIMAAAADAARVGAAWEAAHAAGSSSPLARSLFRVLSSSFITCTAIYLGVAAGTLTSPVICQQIIVWVASLTADVKVGAALVTALGGAISVGCLSQSFFDLAGTRAGMRARDAVSALVFAKMLRLRGASSSSSGAAAGDIQRLVSVDAASLENFVSSAVSVIMLPLEMLGLMGLMGLYVQWAALAGIGALLVCLAAAVYAAERLRARLTLYAEAAARRLRHTQELLRDARSVKMGAFEVPLVAAIASARADEAREWREAAWLQIAVFVLSAYANKPVFMATITGA